MIPSVTQRIHRHVSANVAANASKENKNKQSFFGDSAHQPFFIPSRGYAIGQMVQTTCDECEKDENAISRESGDEKEMTSTQTFSDQEETVQNTRHYANCEGVQVEGHTDANYGNSYTAPGISSPAKDCTDCSGDDCVTNTGTVISVFTTNPQITLPDVPSGLNECEQRAVQNFINTTLRAHEQQHVAAFNTYRGIVRTPYTYHGCSGGLDAYTQQIHENIETARKALSDAASAALDANGANIFNVTCDCPDPEPEPGNSEE